MADPAEHLRDLVARAVERLESEGVRDEAIGALKPARKIVVFSTSPALSPIGRAWRLGVLLIDRDGGVYATGKLTRAVEPGRVTNQNPGFEVRRGYRAAASRSSLPAGAVINFDVVPLAIDVESLRAGSGPLSVDGDTVMVRWASDPAAITPLDRYLDDRIEVLLL